MEFADAINSATFATAVQLTRDLQADRTESLAQSATEAVARSFCACVTTGEDAAEHRLSAIHHQLIEEVMRRVRDSGHLSAEGVVGHDDGILR